MSPRSRLRRLRPRPSPSGRVARTAPRARGAHTQVARRSRCVTADPPLADPTTRHHAPVQPRSRHAASRADARPRGPAPAPSPTEATPAPAAADDHRRPSLPTPRRRRPRRLRRRRRPRRLPPRRRPLRAGCTPAADDDHDDDDHHDDDTGAAAAPPVNVAPSFTAGASQTVLEDSGAHAVTALGNRHLGGPVVRELTDGHVRGVDRQRRASSRRLPLWRRTAR